MVGSMRMAQGILQPKSSRSSAWRGVPMMLAFTIKLVNTVFRTSVSMSRKMPMIYLYILLSARPGPCARRRAGR